MLMPRFTIRTALAGVTLCALMFLIVGFAFRGDNFAWGFTISLISLVVTALVHAVWFAIVWLFVQLPAAQPAAVAAPPIAPGRDARVASSELRGEVNG